MTRDISSDEPLRSKSLCDILSDEMGSSLNMLGLLSSACITHIACYWKFFLVHYIQASVSPGFAKQIMPILFILCYNGSLVTWMIVSLTTAKFKPLVFSTSGFDLSSIMNMFILMILYGFCLLPAQFFLCNCIHMEGSMLCANPNDVHLGNIPMEQTTLLYRCCNLKRLVSAPNSIWPLI
jgi:hypothetical protein